MSEKRFRFEKECTENFFTEKGVFYNNERPMGANEIIALLNSLSEENEQLRTQLLICQQSKNDDGRFQVWQVPPLKKGMRITTFTTSNGDMNE